MRLFGPLMPEPSLWPSVETDLKNEQLTQLETKPTLLFLGSSATEAAVDPAMLESLTDVILPYNSALPFSSPLSNEVWLETVVFPTVAPDLLVIGVPVWPAHGSDPGALGQGIRRAATEPVSVEGSGWSALLGKKGVMADWNRLTQRERLKASGLWTDLGHQTGYYDQSAGGRGGSFPPYGEPRMSQEQADALERIIVASREREAEVILLLEPARFPGEVSSSDVLAYITWLEQRALDWDVTLWDSYSIEWDASLFADDVHFNRAGTEEFTRYLADLLNERPSSPG